MLAENVPVGTILTSSDRNIVMGAGKLQTKTLAQSYRFPVNEEQFSKDRISKSNIEFPAATLQQYSQDNIVKVVFSPSTTPVSTYPLKYPTRRSSTENILLTPKS